MRDIQHLLFRSGLAVTGLGRRQRLSILIYHRVMSEHDWMRPAEPTCRDFAWQMQLLRRHFHVLPLLEAVSLLRENRLPPRAACITFDDGYADNATLALPILQKHGLPATVFVTSGMLNGGRMWNDTIIETLRRYDRPALDLSDTGLPCYPTADQQQRRTAAYALIRHAKYLEPVKRQELADGVASRVDSLPENLMLTHEQLRALQGHGIEIGGHTVSHPILAQLPLAQAREEIQQGKQQLEAITGAPVRAFAYPNGQYGNDYTEAHAALVQAAGFDVAVATNWGVSTALSDPFQLPRFTPWDKSSARFLVRMARNMRNPH